MLWKQLISPELGRHLASTELTGVRRIRKSLTLVVNKRHQRAEFQSLEDKLYQFEPSFGGVLLSYDGLTELERIEPGSQSGDIQVTVRANFYVFFTAPGQYLSVRIVQKQADSARARVNDYFQMLVKNVVAGRHKVGQEIIVKVRTVSYTRGVPQLGGETVPGTRRQLVVELESRKILNLLETKDDELTGLEVVEVAGKGKGVRAVQQFSRGDPVVEYVGLLSNLGRSGRNRARTETARGEEEETVFNFYFHNGGNQYKIDASQETGRLGRMVNHSIVAANTNLKVNIYIFGLSPDLDM